MIYLSVLSFVAAVLYFYVGFNALRTNMKSDLYRSFFALTLSMTIWAFGYGFIYLAENVYEYSFWNKITAFGWCTFEALVLYFVVVFTENRFAKNWYIKFFIALPAPVFLFMVLFLFGPDIDTNPVIEQIFYIGNFAYNFIYLAVSILLVYLWGRKSKSVIKKKQANILVICSSLPFILNLICQTILPALGMITLPSMGQIFTLIMLLGVYYVIVKYQFLGIPNTQITNELFNELTGLVFLTDSQGYIIKANKQAYALFEREEDEIAGSNITVFINHWDITNVMKASETIRMKMRFTDISITLQPGVTVPFNVSIIPLLTKASVVRGLLFIGEDIRVTKWLQEEVERQKQENVKLLNKKQN